MPVADQKWRASGTVEEYDVDPAYFYTTDPAARFTCWPGQRMSRYMPRTLPDFADRGRGAWRHPMARPSNQPGSMWGCSACGVRFDEDPR